MARTLARIYGAGGNHPKRRHARKEKIVSSLQLNEMGQICTSVGWIVGIYCSLNHEISTVLVISDQNILVISLSGIITDTAIL
jgi:hypothetical protein